ncbi:hypothetical protein [Chelativorans salis]|uniref:Uncharacterized protein n=1 Tax=Chelativorans salis TaxID=2978478 RepID=A0ABT2LJS3_9HYPH|nr:hypothetical protein [Chelativorans sp. EGI FJ00035]MCT7374491.1 hypothetical protein [Chelativorans sp. EGI FJ00035]
MAARRYPLPKRFQAALSEEAYARLRELNTRYGLGNNYLLTIMLERLDDFADPEKLDTAFKEFITQYGAPASGMSRNA